MTQEDIKNMNEDEFVELIKKYLPKYKVDKIYNNKLSKQDKRTNRSVVITLGLLMGVIPLGLGEELLKKEASLSLTAITFLSSMILSYIICNKSRKKEYIKTKEDFNDRLINLKNNITNLSEEEFVILSKCYEYIEENQLVDDIINSDKVLEIADELLDINAANILREFEVKLNEEELLNHYDDSEINMDNSYIKSNI